MSDSTFALKIRKIGTLLRQLEKLEAREVPAVATWWGDAGVGQPATVGTATTSTTGTLTVQGAGNGLTGTSDQFHFRYKEITGDGSITAKVTSVTDADGIASGGLMFRNGTAANSAFAAVTRSTNGTWSFSLRSTPDGLVSTATYAGPSAQFAKLVRNGPLFSAYVSANGQDGSWTLVGTGAFAAGNTLTVGAAVTSLGSNSLASGVFENLTIADPPPLGANLEEVIDWAYSNSFVDMTKQAREFMTADSFQPVAVDANGWPTADSMIIFQSGLTNQAHIYNGTYKLSFTGQATIDKWVSPATVSNIVYDSATNTTTADVTLSASASSEWYLGIVFRNTKRTAASPVGSGVMNVRMIRPGYNPATAPTFTTEFTNQLKGFTTLRFMDWLETNHSTVANWSERTPMNYARQTYHGVAWEYIVQLGNQLGKDIWINVPTNATNDYVTNLATYLKNNLNPDRAVYVEWSNEVWNWGFQQCGTNYNAAIAEVNAGTGAYNYDGDTNAGFWAWRRVGEQIRRISDGFRAVWGDAAMNTRVRPVLAAQSANPETFRQAVKYINDRYGDVSRYVYALAGAPYFSLGSVDTNPNLTVDQVIAGLQAAMQSAPEAMAYSQLAALAQGNGLKMVAYEGGPDTFGSNNIQAKKASQLDPRMQQIVVDYLNQWFSNGGGLFNWFTAGATNWDSPYGTWGLTNDMTNTNTPKIRAINQVLAGSTPSYMGGEALPSTFSAQATVGSTVRTGNRYFAPGQPLEYMLCAPANGQFTFRLGYATDVAGRSFRITLNGKVIQTVNLPTTPTWDTYMDAPAVTLNLQAGQNVLKIEAVGTGFMISNLKFTTAATATTLSASSTGSLTANVAACAGGVATGMVNFYAGSTMLGSANLDATGKASFTPSSVPAGNQIFSAVFVGSSTFATSTSQGVARPGSNPSSTDVTSPATPPTVTSVVIGNGAVQRSIVRSISVTFDRVVTLLPGAFELTLVGGIAPTVSVMTSTVAGKTMATLTFGGTGIVAGSLADGVYSLRLVASKVVDAALPGNVMAADRVDTFHRLYGDVDGDRDVDSTDYTAFRIAYLATPVFTAFDYDGNGTVDSLDFRQFSLRFGRRL
ncbi:MAG: Ig-like domain repeat protein [Gemmataceae bacterium]|nr:Ig-like domain repeat protein [Gemmataceae bacterium]